MRRFVYVLAWLPCVSHGQQAHGACERPSSSPLEETQRQRATEALVALLLAGGLADAFRPPALTCRQCNPGAYLRAANLHLVRPRGRLIEGRDTRWGFPEAAGPYGRNDWARPNMEYDVDFPSLDWPADPSVPRNGMSVPPEDCILRKCRVAKVDDTGVWLEVDPSTGLHGFVYPVALDNAYVRNIEKTFKVGDILDAKTVDVSLLTGKLLLSRAKLMDEEGWEKHELPMDGRERPEREIIVSNEEEDRVPEDGTILRDLPVVNVTSEGVWCMVDKSRDLQGFIYKIGVDNGYIESLEKTIKIGDRLDAISLARSGISGKLLLTRRQLMDKEGWEKHELPNDGRERPVRPIETST